MSDVILDEGEQVTVQCNNLNVQGHDFVLDAPTRRKPKGPRLRRALVHDFNDGLTINYAGDYPGGVLLNGVAEIRPHSQPGASPFAFSMPTLVVRGAISYEVQGFDFQRGGGITSITVDLDAALNSLQSQITDLVAKVTALQAGK